MKKAIIYGLGLVFLHSCIYKTNNTLSDEERERLLAELNYAGVAPSVAPSALGFSEATFTTAKVSWTAPPDFGSFEGRPAALSYYQLDYSVTEAFPADNTATVFVRGLDTILRELSPNLKYYTRVRAVNDNRKSDNNASPYVLGSFETLTIPALTAPRNFKVEPDPAGNLAVIASWDAPDFPGQRGNGLAAIGFYTLEYDTAADFSSTGKQSVSVRSDNKPSLVYTLPGLSPGTTYYFRVIANNNANATTETVLSAPYNTSSYEVKPDKLQNLRAQASSIDAKTIIDIDWDTPTGATAFGRDASGNAASLSGYRVEYATDTNFTNVRSIDVGATVPYSVTGLTSDTTYYFRVVSVNDSNPPLSSDPSDVAVLKTDDASTAPGVFTVNSATSVVTSGNGARTGTITLTWDEPLQTGLTSTGAPSALTRYWVKYSTDPADEPQAIPAGSNPEEKGQSADIPVNTRSYTISNLKNYTNYYVWVFAENDTRKVSESSPSPNPTRTLSVASSPGAPAITSTTSSTSNTNTERYYKVALNLTAPTSVGTDDFGNTGAVDHYVVYYRQETDPGNASFTPTTVFTRYTDDIYGTTAEIDFGLANRQRVAGSRYTFKVTAVLVRDDGVELPSPDSAEFTYTFPDRLASMVMFVENPVAENGVDVDLSLIRMAMSDRALGFIITGSAPVYPPASFVEARIAVKFDGYALVNDGNSVVVTVYANGYQEGSYTSNGTKEVTFTVTDDLAENELPRWTYLSMMCSLNNEKRGGVPARATVRAYVTLKRATYLSGAVAPDSVRTAVTSFSNAAPTNNQNAAVRANIPIPRY